MSTTTAEQPAKQETTLADLIELNPCYAGQYGITETEVQVIKLMRREIESIRRGVPISGDIVMVHSKSGKTFPVARVDSKKLWCGPRKTGFFTTPSVPWALGKDRVNISGGSFHSVETRKFRLVGQKDGFFRTWGRGGARADGWIVFFATVNLWEVDEEF